MEIPFMNVTLNNQDANHKYRLALIDGSPQIHWLIRIRFSNKDRSIYFSPIFKQEFIVRFPNQIEIEETTYNPEGDFHLSIHESRVVNFTSPEGQVRLRQAIDPSRRISKIVTMGVSSTSGLSSCSLDEFSNPEKNYLYLPVVGFLIQAPIFVTFFYIETGEEGPPSVQGDLFNIIYKLVFPKKGYEFCMVVWQDSKAEPFGGEIAFQWHE